MQNHPQHTIEMQINNNMGRGSVNGCSKQVDLVDSFASALVQQLRYSEQANEVNL